MNSNTHCKKATLPFLGNALRWLTGTATTKDVNSIKECVNQLTETQSTQQETLVHIVSISQCHESMQHTLTDIV